MNSRVWSFALLLLIIPLWAQANKTESATETFSENLVTADIIKLAQQGGLVLYMRHGKTDTKIPDQVPIDLKNCATQRPLTAEGLAEVKQIGVWFKQLAIPYSDVFASPLCRAKQTAIAAFGESITVEVNLQYTAALTTEEKQPIIKKTYELLTRPLKQGENRVLVAHGPNLVEMMAYFPPEGTIVFIRPLGDKGFEYLGSIPPKHWPVLLKQLGQ